MGNNQMRGVDPLRCLLLLVMLATIFTYAASGMLVSAVIVTPTHVTGRIIDDSAEGISQATVHVYSTSTGGLIEDILTDDAGYFTFSVYIYDEGSARYDLVFTKAGYSTLTKTVSVIPPAVELGDLQLSKSLKISLQITKRTATQGTSLELPFEVTNNGKNIEECTLHIDCPAGWKTEIVDDATPLSRLALQPGATAKLKARIDIPLGAREENLINITAVGSSTITCQITLDISDEQEEFLSCQFPSKTAPPGSTISYQIEIQNPLDIKVQLDLSVDSVTTGIYVTLENSQKETISEIHLESGEKTTLHAIVQIGMGITEGEYILTIRASAQENYTLPLKTKVEKSIAAIQVTAKYPSQVIAQGETATFPITIRNLGSTDEVFELSADSKPPGWTVSFVTKENQEIKSVLIEANGMEQISALVTPSLESKPGAYSLPLEVETPNTRETLSLDVAVSGSYTITIDLSAFYFQVKSGSAYAVTAQITNDGYSPLTNLQISTTSLPTGWELDTTPLKTSTLGPNEKQQFQITIQPPEATAPSDYLVKLIAKSDQASSEEQVIRVTVTSETTWTTYGLVLVLAVFVVIILILRKVRRR